MLRYTRTTLKIAERSVSLSIILVITYQAVMILYIVLHFYGSSQFQVTYLYCTTAAYLVGAFPTVIIFLVATLAALITIPLCMSLSITQKTSTHDTIVRIDGDDVSSYLKEKFIKIALRIGVEILVLAVSIFINLAYIAVIYFKRQDSLYTVVLGFTCVKAIYSMAVLSLSDTLPKSLRHFHYLFTLISIYIVSPAIAILLISPDCLYFKLKPDQVSVDYTYSLDIYSCLSTSGACGIYPQPVSSSVSITPEWAYSFKCSSSFLSSYLPILILTYVFRGIVTPLYHLLAMTIFKSRSPIMSNKLRREIYFVTTTDEDVSANFKYEFTATEWMPNICFDVIIMLTFGLASPLLAILVTFCILVRTILLRIAIGRYIHITSAKVGIPSVYQSVETALTDQWKCLSRSWCLISFVLGTFWAIFIFDTVGNHNYNAAVPIATLFVLWFPIILVSFQKLFSQIEERKSLKFLKSIETFFLFVHYRIWTSLLRLSYIRNDEKTESSIELSETVVSPIADVQL